MKTSQVSAPDSRAALRLCDRCCDNSGTLKEMIKSGGCTCDVCGWSCKCVGEECRQFINHIPVRLISSEGWAWLQEANLASQQPLDWERLFAMKGGQRLPGERPARREDKAVKQN